MTNCTYVKAGEPSIHSALVECEWLQENLGRDHQVILDATFFLPRQQRDAQQEFQIQHIAGAQFFDIDAISDRSRPLPHTLPSTDQFARQVGQLGIDNDTLILIYDNNHFFASARAWWMFRVFGHERVKVLDGGLYRWRQLSLPLTSAMPKPSAKTFKAEFRPELFADLHGMIERYYQGDVQILDARSPDSFNGKRPLQETDLKAGHIPGSTNVAYQYLFRPDNQCLPGNEELRRILANSSVDFTKPIVTTCGSGVSAALLLLALYQLGLDAVPMYDGSWAEWGRLADLPVDQGD